MKKRLEEAEVSYDRRMLRTATLGKLKQKRSEQHQKDLQLIDFQQFNDILIEIILIY